MLLTVEQKADLWFEKVKPYLSNLGVPESKESWEPLISLDDETRLIGLINSDSEAQIDWFEDAVGEQHFYIWNEDRHLGQVSFTKDWVLVESIFE